MRKNPYPGTREFGTEEAERFFGRAEEVDIVAGLVQARRASLLFAQSGAGKSSLINAGVVPELIRPEEIGRGRRRRTVRKMHVLPIAGVGGGIPSRLARPLANVFTFSALHSLHPDADPDELAGQRLADGLETRLEEGDDSTPVLLVFDQFEELFTHHVERWRERLPFFEEVREALDRYSELHVLFSMREDFIAELTPFASLLPGKLRDRFRLERLRPEPALQAVRRPAELAGCPFEDGVAEELVDNLRRAQAGRRGASEDGEPRLGEYVEPVHLQIVCRQLWQNLDDGRASIASRDVRELGDVDEALRGFYEQGLASVLEHTQVREYRLREWFETTTLITPARTRGLVYRGVDETEGLPNEAVDRLVDTYLVRGTQRGSDTWYELAHDRLVEPILAANREWKVQHLRPVTVAAEAWAAAERDPRKLYSGGQLAEARAAAKASPGEHSPLELEFVEASAEAERRTNLRRWRQRATGVGAAVLFAALVAAGLLSAWNLRTKQVRTEILELREYRTGGEPLDFLLAVLDGVHRAQCSTSPGRDCEEILEIFHQAVDQGREIGRPAETPRETDAAAFRVRAESNRLSLSGGNGWRQDLTTRYSNLIAVGVDAGGTRVVTAAEDGTLRVWERRDHSLKALTPPWVAHKGGILALAVDPVVPPRSPQGDGGKGRVLTSGARGGLGLWSLSGREERHAAFEDAGVAGLRVNAVAWSRDGRRIALGGKDGVVRVWDPRQSSWRSFEGHAKGVRGVAFDKTGRRLASVSDDSTLRIWNLDADQEEHWTSPLLGDENNELKAVAWSGDGRWIAAGGTDKRVRLWDLGDGKKLVELAGHEGSVLAVAFCDHGTLVSGGRDSVLKIWGDRGNLTTFGGFKRYVNSVACAADGTIAVTSYGGSVKVVAAGTTSPELELRLSQHDVTATALSADAAYLASGSSDGSVHAWAWDDSERFFKRLITPIEGGWGAVEAVAIDSEGRRIAAFTADRTFRNWNLEGELLLEFPAGASADVVALAFHGETLVSHDGGDRSRFWDLSELASEDVLQVACDRLDSLSGELSGEREQRVRSVVSGACASTD